MTRSFASTLLVALAIVALFPSTARAYECILVAPAQILSFSLQETPASNLASLPKPTPVASWTLLGCWKSRPWLTTCFDVFRDDTGTLYICKACGTTGNPNKGKCRQTTQSELDSGNWCSATQ